MRKKLKDARGETLVEVLVSVLIGALSVAMLFGASRASYSLDKRAEAAEATFVESLNSAEKQTVSPISSITIKVEGGGESASISSGSGVTVYGQGGVISYQLIP